jgi:hypothetical protein
MVIRLDIDICVIGKGGTKKGEWEKGWVSGGRGIVAAGFCGPFVCLGIFLLFVV